MREKIIARLLFTSICLISSCAIAANVSHLEKLKSKFPYGLLGDDYGILTVNDLAINACIAEPTPFDPAPDVHSYQYWQCFQSKNISISCDSNGIRDEYEGVMGFIVLKAIAGEATHEYIEHRAWPIRECKRFVKDASIILKAARYACISGQFIKIELDNSGHKSTSWLFERIKTKKGCEGRDCWFTKEFKKQNCLVKS